MFNPERINRYLYVLDYPYEYYLDDFLKKGACSTFELGRFVQKYNHLTMLPKQGSQSAGCTTFHTVDSGGNHLMGRNFDFKDGPCMVVKCSPENGYKSISVTAMNTMLYGFDWMKLNSQNEKRLFMAPYACMDGINEKGLAIAVLELKAKPTHQNTGRIPVTTSSIIRAVLDRCANADEAVEMFSSFDMNGALFCDYHYQIVDAEGHSVVVEYVDNKMHVLDNQQYAMNFYILPEGDNRHAMGYERETLVRNALAKDCMSADEAMSVLKECRLDYRHKRGYRITCLWSAVYDCSRKSMTLCAGMDYSEKYKFEI